MDLSKLKIYDRQDFPAYLPKLNSLYDDLFGGGKGFRSKLIQQIGDRIALPENLILLLAQTIEFIHNASLLHDDLIDRSPLRRQKTTAWLKYTPEYAVLAGDYLLARVMVNLSKHGNVRLIQYTAEMISDLLEGEWIQDSLVRDFAIKQSQLERVHNLKTASLFKWCLRAPFIAKERYDESLHNILQEMGILLGILFQRSDDLLDYDIRNDEGKAVLGDLKAGYLNSFSVHLLEGIEGSPRMSLIKSESLEQFKATYSESLFEQRLKEFDEINQKLVDLYAHYLEQLRQYLLPDEIEVSKALEPLARLLYWRRK